MKPYQWQEIAIKRFKDKQVGGLDVSCGLGKTYTLINLIKYKSMPTIVIAPKSICNQWKQELLKENFQDADIWVHDQQTMTKGKHKYLTWFADFIHWQKNPILIIPTQNFSLGFKGKKKIEMGSLPLVIQMMIGKFGKEIFCILDESSWIKTSTALKSGQSIRSKMIMYLGNLVNHKMIATGTLMTKSPMNVYNQIGFLDSNYFNETAEEFFRKYTITRTYYFGRRQPTVTAISKSDCEEIRNFMQGKYGLSEYNEGKNKETDILKLMRAADKYSLKFEDMKTIATSTKYFPYRNLDELYERMNDIIYKVQRDEVFDIQHDKFVYEPMIRNYTLSTDQQKIYKEIINNGFTNNFYLGKAAGAELLVRCQDICLGQEPLKNEDEKITYIPFKENPKLETLMDLIQEIDDEEQIVIWCTRIIGIKSIADRLYKEGIEYVVYTGQQDGCAKIAAEKGFEDGNARVFLANPAAAGFGLNCLRNCNYMIWYTVNDSVEQYHQAQHRILRGESKGAKFAYSIMAEKTVEEKQFENIKRGEEFLKLSNNKEMFEYGN